MRTWLAVAAINGFLAVAAGAFGAHALRDHLEPRALTIFDTGARYHILHALALGLAAFAMQGAAAFPARVSATLFFAGIVLFSGSLYALSFTHFRALGFVTPLGGIAFLGGWLALAWAAMRLPR